MLRKRLNVSALRSCGPSIPGVKGGPGNSVLLDIGTALIRGVVDAVIDDDIIVDYKTGHPDPSVHHYYEMQASLYAAAFQTLKGKYPSRGCYGMPTMAAPVISFNENNIRKVLQLASTCCKTA